MAVESQKNIFKGLEKLSMSQKLLVFEVMNEKQTCFNIGGRLPGQGLGLNEESGKGWIF